MSIPSDLVTANRILVQQGVLDAFGHVSARLAHDRFILSRNLAPGLVTEDDLIEYDLDGNSADERAGYLERFIHAEIYRARPDVAAVVHSHSAAVVPFSTVAVGLRPILHMAGFLGHTAAPVFEIRERFGDSTDLLVTCSEHGRALASVLGERTAALMRGHGSVAVAHDIPSAVYRAVYVEANAKAQADALRLGEPTYLSAGEAETTSTSIGSQVHRAWKIWAETTAPANS